jgi:hypothetical protein
MVKRVIDIKSLGKSEKVQEKTEGVHFKITLPLPVLYYYY